MITRRNLIPAVFLALAACASAPPDTAPAGAAATPSADAGEPARPSLSDEERQRLEDLYHARADSARMDVSPADVRFMTGMISHHAQALVMSGMAPDHGASPEMRILTSRIINAQTDEIRLMQAWLRDRGQPVPEVEIEGLTLLVNGAPPMHMHGMLTDAQLRELDAARGPAWDRLFLKYMIMHHEGAVAMVTELFGTDGAANDDLAFKLASDIQVDQITEIRRMKLMLEDMGGRR